MGLFYNMFYKRDEPVAIADDGRRFILPTPANYGSLMSVDFAACVQTKARSMASLPVSVVLSKGREKLDDNPLAKLLNGMVNEDMSAASLMAWTVLRRDTLGNAYWYIEWSGGVPVAIYPVNVAVSHDFDKSRPKGKRTVYSVASGDKYVPAGTYFADEIINIPTAITRDAVKGVSLASLAAEQIGLSIDLERFYRSMLNNGNHHLGHVEVPNEKIKAEELEMIKSNLRSKAGIDKSGEPPIFGYGAKWVPDQQTMKDASLIDQQKWILHQVCRACNVPPWKVYDGEVATYNGGQQMRIDYVTDTIVPEVRAIELALKPVLDSMMLFDAQVKFKLQGLMRGDDAARGAYYQQMIFNGTYTREDVRELEDLKPIAGIDLPFLPLNYGTVNPDGTVNVFNADSNKPEEGE